MAEVAAIDDLATKAFAELGSTKINELILSGRFKADAFTFNVLSAEGEDPIRIEAINDDGRIADLEVSKGPSMTGNGAGDDPLHVVSSRPRVEGGGGAVAAGGGGRVLTGFNAVPNDWNYSNYRNTRRLATKPARNAGHREKGKLQARLAAAGGGGAVAAGGGSSSSAAGGGGAVAAGGGGRVLTGFNAVPNNWNYSNYRNTRRLATKPARNAGHREKGKLQARLAAAGGGGAVAAGGGSSSSAAGGGGYGGPSEWEYPDAANLRLVGNNLIDPFNLPVPPTRPVRNINGKVKPASEVIIRMKARPDVDSSSSAAGGGGYGGPSEWEYPDAANLRLVGNNLIDPFNLPVPRTRPVRNINGRVKPASEVIIRMKARPERKSRRKNRKSRSNKRYTRRR